jgi:hypothetical protein
MNTTFWGPSGWKFLHSITAIYPDKPTFTDKMLMRDFMIIVCDILPCKYCRASFSKYYQTLDITKFLNTNTEMQEWMYKMHNKVNGKLRRQGFCTTENPTFESVKKKYINMTILPIELIYEQIRIKKLEPSNGMQKIIKFICNLGYNFLGSIVFNYQGYFANCHTNEEKTKILSNYHKFFNMIPIIIHNYVAKLNPSANIAANAYEIPKYKIKNILLHNEPYSKLKNWFYNCDTLSNNSNNKFSTIEQYEHYFNKHIVATCNNPVPNNIKSCRWGSKPP